MAKRRACRGITLLLPVAREAALPQPGLLTFDGVALSLRLINSIKNHHVNHPIKKISVFRVICR